MNDLRLHGLSPRCGRGTPLPRDAITDIGGIRVGHATVAEGARQTGVTVLSVHDGDAYRDKVPAGVAVINGFGKSVGLLQIEELGTLDTPIALTNTFSVGAIASAQIRQAVAANPAIGRGAPTLNPLVLECNDGVLNDIQAMALDDSHYAAALQARDAVFAQGAVGAGRGMVSFDLKGGIGSASRRAATAYGDYGVGALVLSNFGRLPQLRVAGQALAERLGATRPTSTPPEMGSIIMVLATDAPLDARQLTRLARRAGAGLARTGSVYGHGSGDIALAVSTAYTIPQDAARPMPGLAMLHESLLDPLFEAAAESVEQAIVRALWRAETVTGRDGQCRDAITARLPNWRALWPALC